MLTAPGPPSPPVPSSPPSPGPPLLAPVIEKSPRRAVHAAVASATITIGRLAERRILSSLLKESSKLSQWSVAAVLAAAFGYFGGSGPPPANAHRVQHSWPDRAHTKTFSCAVPSAQSSISVFATTVFVPAASASGCVPASPLQSIVSLTSKLIRGAVAQPSSCGPFCPSESGLGQRAWKR